LPQLTTLANPSNITTGALNENEIIITIDEVPFSAGAKMWSDDLAISLKSGSIAQAAGTPVAALFFVVGNKLVTGPEAYVTPAEGSNLLTFSKKSAHWNASRLKGIYQEGHWVANHTFFHPVGSAGFDELHVSDPVKAYRELLWTHQVILEYQREVGHDGSRYLRLFRPSGGEWAGIAQGNDLQNRLTSSGAITGGYGGPVGWSVPAPGKKPDWECMRELTVGATTKQVLDKASECARDHYVASLSTAGWKGLALFHGNLVFSARGAGGAMEDVYFSEAIIREFVSQARAARSQVRFLPPPCFVRVCALAPAPAAP
jgi:peptidoglycan/xylan/chitin deacetylase (PgdA/CDA1 family)